MIKKMISTINAAIDLVGAIAALLLICLVGLLAYNVIARYAFSASSIGIEELSWHLYASVFLLGIPYAFKEQAHVRVDLFYDKLSQQTKAWVNLGGNMLLLWPFCLIVVFSGGVFTLESWGFGERPLGWFELLNQIITDGVGEKSQDPGGLNNRWFIKGVIPFSFLMLCLAGVSNFMLTLQELKSINHPQQTKE